MLTHNYSRLRLEAAKLVPARQDAPPKCFSAPANMKARVQDLCVRTSAPGCGGTTWCEISVSRTLHSDRCGLVSRSCKISSAKSPCQDLCTTILSGHLSLDYVGSSAQQCKMSVSKSLHQDPCQKSPKHNFTSIPCDLRTRLRRKIQKYAISLATRASSYQPRGDTDSILIWCEGRKTPK